MNTTGNDSISEVNTKPGIMWTYDGGDYPDVPVIFGFQTALPYSPVLQIVDGDSWTGKTSYSANPEPGSLLLLGIVMAGGKFWRRRRTSRK
jgi:hypothetical protein